MIGDALAFSHVQMLWDRVWIGPVQQLWNAFAAWDWALVLSPNGLPSQSYCAAWAVLGLAVAGWLAWRRRWAEAWLLAASILLPLSTAMHSLPRFVASNPFFLFACFDGLQALRGRLTFRALAGAGIAVQAVVIAGWFISANSLY
jgi:hypothetical protein